MYLQEKQKECIKECVEGNNHLMALLPTGYGKSILFSAIPAYWCLHHQAVPVSIIVIPLNSIISQQLQNLGPKAAHYEKCMHGMSN